MAQENGAPWLRLRSPCCGRHLHRSLSFSNLFLHAQFSQGLCPNLCNGLRGRALQVPKLQQQGADRQGLPEDRDLCAAKGLFLENLVKMKKKTKCKNKYSSQKRKKIKYKYSENFSGRRMGVARKLWFLQLPRHVGAFFSFFQDMGAFFSGYVGAFV